MTCSPDHTSGKSLLASKTFWVNVLAVVGMVVTSTGWLVEADWVQYEAVALGALNVALRLYTGEPITGIVVTPEK
jgi:hypothetical protein